ncbi:MAG: hypothetical protein M3391_08160 [Actinomycetota bacterium]|nr:hypothetical protein [Actinomycetota bacterium]
MADQQWSRLEADLKKVAGVRSARVIGANGAPTEIHIVSTSTRAPKQVVRDVQSLAAAGFGMPIDHRIVSIVQLDEPLEPDPPPVPESQEVSENGRNGHRPVLERVVLASRGESGWVKVALKWPDGQTTEGASAAGASREARARGATAALMQAMRPVLEDHQSAVEVDQVVVQRIGSNDSVVVRAIFYENGMTVPVIGSALVHDDVATASVRAMLQALNRKLQAL